MIVRFLETHFNSFNVTDLIGCDGEYYDNKCGECWKFVYAPNEITGLKNCKLSCYIKKWHGLG